MQVMTDPDAPSPSEPSMREWVHWSVASSILTPLALYFRFLLSSALLSSRTWNMFSGLLSTFPVEQTQLEVETTRL